MFFYAGQSLWPIQLCITSLPPNIRMNLRYLLLAGVWLGNVKPSMNIILKPVLQKIHSLYTNGKHISTPSGTKILKAKLLACVFDLPAKAMALNFTQWNGNHGCSYCLDSGTQVSHRRLYLPNDEHKPRKEKETFQHAKQAIRTGSPMYGVKGMSVLTPYLNIIKDVPIDYMHAVLEGVIKTILCKIWLKGEYRNHRFYLLAKLKAIDKHLLTIKPPHEFRRSPRSIENTVKHWKASEFRAFLLFYSIPILMNFFPPDYLHHLNLLVKSVYILLSTHIYSESLIAAEEMLMVFYRTLPRLYPNEVCTVNVHSLIHICQSVQHCGPLWSYSCFGFESMNGHLKKHCHGTRNVLPQLVRNVRNHQTTDYKANSQNGICGRVKHSQLKPEFVAALQNRNFSVPNHAIPVFSRYKLSSVEYQIWNSERLRNSAACKFKKANGITAFGLIYCFCLYNRLPIAIIATFPSATDAFDGVPAAGIAELNNYALTNSCIFKVEKISDPPDYEAISVSSIIVKCVHVPSQSCDYVIPLPNTYEHH